MYGQTTNECDYQSVAAENVAREVEILEEH